MIKVDEPQRIIKFTLNEKEIKDPNFNLYHQMSRYGVMRQEKRIDGQHHLKVAAQYRVGDVARFIQKMIKFYLGKEEEICQS